MTRKLSLILFSFLWVFAAVAADSDLATKLSKLKGVKSVEKLESEKFPEKYLVRFEQQVDPKDPSAGTFTQRVIVCHKGYDKPTVQVTEGYGAQYALWPRYEDELSRLFDTNVIFVEHRYFLDSTPDPCNWDYLTAENSAYDLHNVNQTFKQLYPGKWITTGVSKGGQTTMIYRSYFPDDVDFSVPYVGPLNTAVEDGRHEPFLRVVGTPAERKKIHDFQRTVLKRRAEVQPLMENLIKEKGYKFRIPMEEVLDFCVLEYPFAFWQWGDDVNKIPAADADAETIFKHLISGSGPEYFAEDQPNIPFFVQAARELGYYGYDTLGLEDLLSIKTPDGYLNRIMLPAELVDKIEWRPEVSQQVYEYLKNNDPKMIFIYGEIDPWSATAAPAFPGKVNEQVYVQPRGSHKARISNMPPEMKKKIMDQINAWLAE